MEFDFEKNPTVETMEVVPEKYRGLYAEITLLYQKGSYAPQQWTYADYHSEELQHFLLEIRSYLMQQRQRQDI